MKKNAKVNDFKELEERVLKHYNIIYKEEFISDEERVSLEDELNKIKAVLNSKDWQYLDAKITLVKLINSILLGVIALNIKIPLLVIAITLCIYSSKLAKKDKEDKKSCEELINKINIMIGNCERMVARKNKQEPPLREEKEKQEEPNALREYAKFVFEEYMETKKIYTFADELFDYQVKKELVNYLKMTYGFEFDDLDLLLIGATVTERLKETQDATLKRKK